MLYRDTSQLSLIVTDVLEYVRFGVCFGLDGLLETAKQIKRTMTVTSGE